MSCRDEGKIPLYSGTVQKTEEHARVRMCKTRKTVSKNAK
jgi:hypothetical protein